MDLSFHMVIVLISSPTLPHLDSPQYVKRQEDEFVWTWNELTVAYFKALVVE
jgi:hypothetical protein